MDNYHARVMSAFGLYFKQACLTCIYICHTCLIPAVRASENNKTSELLFVVYHFQTVYGVRSVDILVMSSRLLNKMILNSILVLVFIDFFPAK